MCSFRRLRLRCQLVAPLLVLPHLEKVEGEGEYEISVELRRWAGGEVGVDNVVVTAMSKTNREKGWDEG